MASPAVMFFGGVITVVVALGAGFGGALMLTSTKPIHKEPAAAFAKRDVARPEPQVAAVAAKPVNPEPPAQPKESLIPKSATTIEDIAALDYAPPQAAVIRPRDPATVAPEPTTTGAAPVMDSAAPIAANTTDSEKAKIKSEPKQKDETASASALPRKTTEKSQRAKKPNYTDKRRVLAEKEAGDRRRLFTERRRRLLDDDGERVSSTERYSNQGEGFFGFLFGQ
jgi:hypothetical protein